MASPAPKGRGQRGDAKMGDETTGLVAAESTGDIAEEYIHPLRPFHLSRRKLGKHSSQFELDDDDDDDDERHPNKRRTFCRSWCEMWFLPARSCMSCTIFTSCLFVAGMVLILVTAMGGIMDCPPLTGAYVFCYLMAILAISLGILCCSYHWVQNDEDLPYAIFCVGYCLLQLYIYTAVAGSTALYTHTDLILSGNYTKSDGEMIDCGMSQLPIVVVVISYIIGALLAVISYCACILALGATSDA